MFLEPASIVKPETWEKLVWCRVFNALDFWAIFSRKRLTGSYADGSKRLSACVIISDSLSRLIRLSANWPKNELSVTARIVQNAGYVRKVIYEQPSRRQPNVSRFEEKSEFSENSRKIEQSLKNCTKISSSWDRPPVFPRKKCRGRRRELEISNFRSKGVFFIKVNLKFDNDKCSLHMKNLLKALHESKLKHSSKRNHQR